MAKQHGGNRDTGRSSGSEPKEEAKPKAAGTPTHDKGKTLDMSVYENDTDKKVLAQRRDEIADRLNANAPPEWWTFHQKDASRNIGFNPVLDTWRQWRSMSDELGDVPYPEHDQIHRLTAGAGSVNPVDPRPEGKGPAVQVTKTHVDRTITETEDKKED
jgi:hypothetical protein